MSALPDPLRDGEELQEITELQDMQVRVVRLGQLGAKVARPPAQEGQVSDAEILEPQPAHARSAPPARPAAPAPRPAAPARSTPQIEARGPQPQAPPAPAREPLAPHPSPAAPPAVAKRTATPAVAEPKKQRRPLLSAGRLFFVLTCVALYYGWSTQTQRYITPQRGIGYWLGIVGGSLMLLLLVYSLRKRWTWLSFLGSTPSWFRFHMVLGILGPLCILYHSNFMTGATNSNVALFAMLTVAGSGLIGRYIYTHMHQGLYGRKLELKDLRDGAEGLRGASGSVSFLPELVTRLEGAEKRVLNAGPRLSALGFAKPVVVALATAHMRAQLHRYIRRALHASARRSAVVAAEQRRLRQTARAYVDRRLAATRRVAEFEGYERLFSLWHALHIPLIFMMIIAAVIHVVAVHVY
jgi:hypothetical protein